MRLLWIASHVALTVLAFRYWDIYLLKKQLDEPLSVAALLFAIFATVCLLRALARRWPESERGWLTRRWASLNITGLLFVAVFLVLAGVQHFAYMRASSDGRAYFLMVRSILIDWDLRFEQDVASFGYHGGVMSYALGTPLLWVPFFLAGHAWLGLSNLFGADYALDGFFNPYQRAVGFGTLVYGMGAIVVMQQLLRRHYSQVIATFATLAVAAGGWLVWYMSVDASWSHAASALSVAMFVSYWDATRDERSPRQWVVFGLLGGFMILVRWQNIFFAIFPMFDALRGYSRAVRGLGRSSLPRLARVHGQSLAAAFVVFFPQLLAWKLGRGSWLDVPAGDHPIFWDSRYFWDTLFHLDRGIFTWTPLMAFAVLGLLFLFRRDPRFAGLLLTAFVLQVWINGTLWWGDHGFGARRFANCAVILAVGLAATLDWARRHPMVAPSFVVVSLTALNVFFMREIHTTDLQQRGNVTAAQMMESVTKRVGHPMALPANAWFAWRYGGDWDLYGRIGAQTFNNARIDIGSPGDGRFLGGGWSEPEGEGDGTFRWAIGARAFVLVQTKESAAYAVEFRAAPFLYDRAPTQSIEIIFNGEHVERLELGKALDTYRVEVPASAVRSGLNALELRFATAVSPMSQGMGRDARPLAVRFERISFLRVP
jgi:hypothetical protein